jgi:hypothetical protein
MRLKMVKKPSQREKEKLSVKQASKAQFKQGEKKNQAYLERSRSKGHARPPSSESDLDHTASSERDDALAGITMEGNIGHLLERPEKGYRKFSIAKHKGSKWSIADVKRFAGSKYFKLCASGFPPGTRKPDTQMATSVSFSGRAMGTGQTSTFGAPAAFGQGFQGSSSGFGSMASPSTPSSGFGNSCLNRKPPGSSTTTPAFSFGGSSTIDGVDAPLAPTGDSDDNDDIEDIEMARREPESPHTETHVRVELEMASSDEMLVSTSVAHTIHLLSPYPYYSMIPRGFLEKTA